MSFRVDPRFLAITPKPVPPPSPADCARGLRRAVNFHDTSCPHTGLCECAVILRIDLIRAVLTLVAAEEVIAAE
jgi:hypothetical protein